MVAANIGEEEGVVAEDISVLGAGVDGTFVEVFGSVVVVANIGEEEGVVAEDVGLVGFCLDGAFVEGLGGIVVATNIGEEEGIVTEERSESRMFAYRFLVGGEDRVGILFVHREDPVD